MYGNPMQSLFEYIMRLPGKIEEKHFTASNPLTIVAVEAASASERISQACREVYAQIEALLYEKLMCCGLSNYEAAEQARLTLVSLGGGIILSRVYRSAYPLQALAGHLKDSLTRSRNSPAAEKEDNP